LNIRSCYWCGLSLDWPIAVVDHLNEDKADNRLENLVISCNNCNRARGALIPFIRRMKSTSLPAFLNCCQILNQRYHHDNKTAKEDGAFGNRGGG